MSVWKKVHKHIVPSHHNAYRPPVLAKTSLAIFFALTLAVEGFLVAGLVARESDGTFLSAVIASDVVSFTNTQRSDAALLSLHEDPELNAAARAKAQDMVSRGYFAHVGPDGSAPWIWIQQAGYTYQYAGENLAVRFNDSKEVVEAWMASPTHRANILQQKYTDVGVGTAEGSYKGKPATFVVQYFATPKTSAAYEDPASLPLASWAHTFTQSVGRSMVRFITEPHMANWVLGGVAAVLLVSIALAFLLHIDVQAHDMLVGGAVVAAVALVCLGANIHFLSTTPQPAAAVESGVSTVDTQ